MTPRPPKKITLGQTPTAGRLETPSSSGTGGNSTSDGSPRITWLLPPFLMASVAGAALLVRSGLQGAFGITVAVLVGLAMAWVMVSVFFPPRVDRTCPACGRASLERIDRNRTNGVTCKSCGHRDEDQSAWLMAEEEGPLEEIVMRERGRAPTKRETQS